MTRSELIERLMSQHPDLPQTEIEKVVLTVLNEIKSTLIDNNRVELRGFGTFTIRFRQGREGRNPRTGEKVQIETKKVPFFKAGKELQTLMNNR
jgi:integration host factor subunit beta